METYPYKDMILNPEQMGVSSDGNLGALKADVKAIVSYVDVLASGETRAQVISPLGNAYFMDTGVKCKDKNKVDQDRYVFVNNIPDKSFIGRGLISGIFQDIGGMNPAGLFKAFSQKEDPCQKITMNTRDNNNKSGQESRYVNNSDIMGYNPCWFSNGTNPVKKTKARCEGFTNRQIPKDPVVQVYLLGIGCIAAYMAYRFIKK
jgi:hypothetical protein